MKGSKLLTMGALLLVLSWNAHCADAQPSKGPLTVAEREQCKAQLTELNLNARTYNAKLDELQALEAEIDAMRVELDKEVAAVDRRDSAAMQALNTKIRKNNEQVERFEQMTSALTAEAGENKQRAAQFREACENRAAASVPSVSSAQAPSDAACGSATGAQEMKRRIESSFAEMRKDEKQHQDEVDRVAQARAKAQSWSKDRQGKLWLQLIASPKFMAFEREKQPLVQELMRIIGSKPRNAQEECQLVQRIAATLPAIKAINTRQYGFMADEIRAAK